MNDWRCNDPCTAADTYIEWRFEQKCREIRDGKNLLTEWRRRKREYISFSSTIFIDFLHFSRHDGSHSISILESIEMLLGKEWIDSLSAGDLWMLLECAYMHDIGMSLDYEEIKELWETNESFRDYVKTALSNDSDDYTYKGALYFSIIDSILRNEHSDISSDVVLEDMFPKSWPVEVCRSISVLITDYIRRNHAERLQRKILKFDPTTDPVIPDRLNKSVVKACVLHGEDFEEIMKQLCYECKGFGNTTIHPRFAAAMLRMGDMLDLDNNRFNPRAINRFGPLPYVSLLHFQKHRAMTHISISPSMIEVVAESPDDDTCSVANEWLTALSSEVKDLICHWNQIVPKELKGCILNTCSTIVYLVDSKTGNKVPYASNPASEFEVNKSKLLELMVGLNLYTSRMDFLREYIQNALDASKMQLWLDIKSGKYSYSDSLNHEMGVYSISPFDIGNDIYENYTIQVSIGYIQSSNKVLIIFSDQGIGMEKDCIEALGKVGSGWRLRKRYNEDLAKMPRWLRPTGGFGIGVQSAFMVADSIRIITFNQFDENGADITMTSPRNKHKDSGKVIYKKLGFIGKGTNIALEINADEFYRNNQDYYDLSQENAPTEIKKWQTEENSKRYSRWVERMFDPLGAMSNTDGNEKGDSANKNTTNKESSNNNSIVNSDNNNINQKNENSNNSQTVDPFEEIKWLDPFSKEKAIKEIVSFVTKYIETIVPFSPFPIRIVDVSKNIINSNPSNTNSTNFITVKAQDILSYVSKGIEQRTVSSLYLPKWKYWTYMFSEKASNAAKTNSSKQQFWATNCSQNGNEYLVLNECDNSIMLTKTFVWDKNNQIAYCVIPISLDNKLSIDNVICFKNILVKEERVPDWSANKSFAIFTSFDGFNAERIIKIHREAFKETFSMQELPKFINDGYRAAFSVIGKLRKIGLIKCTQFSAVDSFVFRYAILKMPDVFDKESDNDTAELETCSAFEHRDYNRIQKRSIPLWQILNMIEKMMKSTDDGLFLYFEPETVKKYNMKENTCLGQNILRLLEGKGAAEQQSGTDDKNSNSSKHYESSDLEEARKNEIEKYGGVLRSIIFALDKEYVYLFEKKTSSILSEIYGVKIEYFKINNESVNNSESTFEDPSEKEKKSSNIGDYLFAYVYFEKEKIKKELNVQKFYNKSFTYASKKEGRYCLSDVPEDFLKDIQVPYIPYNINVSTGQRFIISPISHEIYMRVEKKFITDRVVTLEDFKELIVNTYDFKNVVDFVWKSRKSMYGQEHIKKSSIREFYVKYIENIYSAITAEQYFEKMQKEFLNNEDMFYEDQDGDIWRF